jgi:hypothetical protein
MLRRQLIRYGRDRNAQEMAVWQIGRDCDCLG